MAGLCTNWRGQADTLPWVREMLARGEAIAVCPEQLGGLATPRVPAEIQGDRVISRTGRDLTAEYERGAERTVAIAREHGCRVALLKFRSPSCGAGKVYDGTFSGRLVDGDGITAKRLREAGFRLFTEKDVRGPEDLEP